MRGNEQAGITRAQFLKRWGGGVIAAGGLLGASSVQAADPTAHQWKGKPGGPVKRWDVITIGNLSRNFYWGESDAHSFRGVICTCTLIQGEGFRLLIDPSIADVKQMIIELDRRTGLKPGDITAVFVTHEHGDHWAGIRAFTDAKWYASAAVAEVLKRTSKLPRDFEAAPGRLFDAIDIVATPGHTPGHHSVRFDCDGVSVVASGDAVATRDFFRERRSFYNVSDRVESTRSMEKLATLGDIIVPGHDNYFLV
jgi:glyoxylase-like metal-dependent hydrolase (beta-lactamase superfamily II)